MCKKTLTKKVLGKRINLGTIDYPCGYKQKTIGSIVLNKNDNTSQKLLFPMKTYQLFSHTMMMFPIQELNTYMCLYRLSKMISYHFNLKLVLLRINFLFF